MHSFFITLLRAGTVGAILIGLFGQIVVLPGMAREEVARFQPYEPYAAPYVTIGILGVVCVQVALVAVWMLLGMAGRGAIFTPKAFRWVDVIIGASLAATALAIGVSVHLAIAPIPTPGDNMGLIGALATAVGCVGVGTAFAMLMVIMRSLLRKATDLQAEMAEVV